MSKLLNVEKESLRLLKRRKSNDERAKITSKKEKIESIKF